MQGSPPPPPPGNIHAEQFTLKNNLVNKSRADPGFQYGGGGGCEVTFVQNLDCTPLGFIGGVTPKNSYIYPSIYRDFYSILAIFYVFATNRGGGGGCTPAPPLLGPALVSVHVSGKRSY